MKPYPFQHLSLAERVFNYRSSRVRRVIKNTFGTDGKRFCVLLGPITYYSDLGNKAQGSAKQSLHIVTFE